MRQKLKQISNLSAHGRRRWRAERKVRCQRGAKKGSAGRGGSRRRGRRRRRRRRRWQPSFLGRVWITSSGSPNWKWKPPNGGNDIKPVTALKFAPFLFQAFLVYLVAFSLVASIPRCLPRCSHLPSERLTSLKSLANGSAMHASSIFSF